MRPYFPKDTILWPVERLSLLKSLTLSTVEMAAITGIVLRLLRAVILTNTTSGSWLGIAGGFTVGALIFFGMATLHLGNYTVRRWLWRVPLFAAVEAAAEMGTSSLLIALHREPLGTGRAHWHDWWAMLASVLLTRVVALVLFALLLAGIVQLVRMTLLRKGHHSLPETQL
jgi:hypothetical protein